MIFGKDAPKFTVSGVGDVLLDYSIIQKDEADHDTLKHTSEITGHVEYITRGYRWEMDVLVHLYKYADPYAKFTEINQYKGSKVTLYRHRDGLPFKNSAGANVEFMIEEINPSYLTTVNYEDVVLIKFRSVDYVDLSQMAQDVASFIATYNILGTFESV